MNVSHRILVHVAAGTAAVIAVVAWVTYALVFDAQEKRVVEHMQTYATERMRREEASFETAYMRLETVRGLFLVRDQQPVPADIDARWNAVVRHDPDGGWRTRKELGDPSLWGHRDLALTPLFEFRCLNALDITRELMPEWVDAFRSVYLTFPGSVCLGYNPDQPDWVWDTPSDYPLEEQEWHYGARPDHNPSCDFVWTAIYPDPISRIPFATLMLPIMKDGEFICTLAHDMRLDRLFTEVTRSDFRGASHMIIRGDGRLIAHPGMLDAILASDGMLTAQDAGDPALSNLYALVHNGDPEGSSGYEPLSKSYFTAARLRLPGADWFFVTTLPRAVVREQAVHSAQWAWLSGVASLALLLGAFGLVLRRQVARPLADLTRATDAMIAGVSSVPEIPARADELGDLAASFRAMNARIVARENELRKMNVSLEQRVSERTGELADANLRLAEALRMEQELGELRANFVSLVSHEFRTPLEIILTSSDILDRYLDRLAPEKRSYHLSIIKDSVKRMSDMMEDILLLGKVEAGKLQFKPVDLDLPMICHRITDELLSVSGHRNRIELQLVGDLSGARGDESLLRHVFANLISNAIKYSPPGETVTMRLARDGESVVLNVIDRGRGIPAADREGLFQSFQRGSNVSDTPGTGLGLLIVRKCAEIHGGSITFESEEGKGTTFRVVLPLFRRAS